MIDGRGDRCERLAGAIADGRYLEDPDVWREHVEDCASCRELVQGLLALRVRIESASLQAREESASPETGEALITEAFRRYRRRRNVEGLSLGIVLLLGLALGLTFLLRDSSSVGETDPIAYAARLEQQVFRDSDPDYDLLKRDGTLRREYLAALDHASSLVRRTALHALTYSGIELDPARLTEVLTTWDEDLEAPLELAAAGDGARHLEDALARRREATLARLLGGAYVQAAQGGARLDAAVIEPFVDDPAPAIRHAALRALSQDPTYEPGDRVVRRLHVDESAENRKAAAMLLVDRLGDVGVGIVVTRLREAADWEIEGFLVSVIGARPALLALSRERVEDPAVPPALALHHLRLHARASGIPDGREALHQRALEDDDPGTWALLARVAGEQDLVDLRTPLQACWARCPAGRARSTLGLYLVRWDCVCVEESRQHLALDILDADRDERLRRRAVDLTESEFPSVRERAQNLISRW